jgi:tryptophanyl-tRNA synthetase
MERRYKEGIGWGTVKQELFEYLNELLREPRKRYNELIEAPGDMDIILQKGAERAREHAVPFLDKIRKAVGIQRL